DLDIDPKTGELHVVCVLNGTGAQYIKLDNSGNILLKETIPGTEDEQGGITYGPSISVDPQGRPHVTFRIPEGGHYYSSYYTYKTESGWVSRIPLSIDTYRGWVVRVDVDSAGSAHIGRGSATGEEPEVMIGPVKYFNFLNNNLNYEQDGFTRYRCDDRIEIDAGFGNQVHMILGCPDYPATGGPVWYWRSFDNGAQWNGIEIHHYEALGANGSPDLFVDASGTVHIIYGSEIDKTVGRKPSVRYSRFNPAGTKVRDVPVTVTREILDRFDTPYGIGSVAASENGEIVIVAYSEDFGARLFVRRSNNGGATWSDRYKIADESVGDLGRNRHTIRAYRSNFYLIYPSPDGIKLKYLKLTVNQPPVADLGGPYQANEGSTITFNASASYDTDGTITKYEWDFQYDGVYDRTTTTATTNYAFNDDFNGQVKLRVTDNESETATDVKSLVIANVAPTAEAGGPYSGEMNIPVQLSGIAADPGNDILTYQWDLDNDGNYETLGQSPQVTFSTGGKYIVKLKVSDDDGGEGIDEANVSITNEPPLVTDIPSQTIKEDEAFNSIHLDNYVSDPDNSDEEITWIASGMNNLSVSIVNRVANIAVVDPEWSGSETITFTATDPGGLFDDTSTVFTVLPVNDAPVMTQIPNQTIDEGGTFNNINLDDCVSDPDNSDIELIWTSTGQKQLIVSINQRVASIQTPDSNWYGSENVGFKVTDPAGLFDSKVVQFKVNPVNDAPVVSKIPDQTIDQSETFSTLDLDDYVNDVDNAKNELTWTHNAAQLLVNINAAIHVTTVSVPNNHWTGSETITFTAKDPAGLTGQNSAVFTVGDFNDPPKVSQIPDQTIKENDIFAAINLDLHVNDPDDDVAEIKWSYRGNQDLILRKINNELTISVPDSEWAGTEILTFIATDPGGKKDSCITIFTVIPVNDPPALGYISDLYFPEDDTLRIRRLELTALVQDIDSPKDSVQFLILNTIRTHYLIDPVSNDLLIYADANWNGTESVLFYIIDDKGGSDSQNINLIVQSSPDRPSPFSLQFPIGIVFQQEPDSIQFIWQKSIDYDPEETPIYQWSLSQDVLFGHVMDQYNNLVDTIFVFRPHLLSNGTYYWRVVAFDPTGRYTQSTNVGVFTVGTTDVEEIVNNKPDEYALFANYPNPFNPETNITFQIPKSCHVKLSIYNNLGQLINVLFEAELSAGIYSKVWNAMDLTGKQVTSGIYLYKLETKDFTAVRKMLYIR
ncbi:MAG: tandem-95 repeat protein, partial [bacterium]